jgi:hypothetical protein
MCNHKVAHRPFVLPIRTFPCKCPLLIPLANVCSTNRSDYIVLWAESYEGLDATPHDGSDDDPLLSFTSREEAAEWARKKKWPQRNMEILAVRIDAE